MDLGGVHRGRAEAARLAPRRALPLRLQLAGQRRHALAQPALPGRRPLPHRGPVRARDRLRRRPRRDRLQPQLLHRRPRAAEQLRAGDHLRQRPLVLADHRDDLRRRVPHPRRRLHPRLRVGRHLLPAQRARRRRLRRQRPRRDQGREEPGAGRLLPRVRDGGGGDARLLRRRLPPPHPSRPHGVGHRVRRAPRARRGVPRPGGHRPGVRLGAGRLARHGRDHHGAQGAAGAGLRRRAVTASGAPPAPPPARRRPPTRSSRRTC